MTCPTWDLAEVVPISRLTSTVSVSDRGFAASSRTVCIDRITIGRTGRFGRKGCSVVFTHDYRSKADVERIMNTLGKPMKRIDARSTTDIEQLEKALKLAMKGPA